MDTVTVVARETFPYAGITRAKGQTFEATVDDARVLRLIGRVDVETEDQDQAPDAAIVPRRVYQRRRPAGETVPE